MPLFPARLGIPATYAHLQILQGLADSMCRENDFETAFANILNACLVLQELDAADMPVPLCAVASDLLDDIACTQELQGKFEETYNYQWVRLKVLTGMDNPLLFAQTASEWTADIAAANPGIADVYSAISSLLRGKAEKLRSEGKAAQAMTFFSDTLTFLQRCHMFKDNYKLIKRTRRDIASCLRALGRVQDADAYESGIVSQVEWRVLVPYAHWTTDKIFYRPTHGGSPVVMPVDGGLAGGPLFGEDDLVVDDAQKKQQVEHTVTCLRTMCALRGFEEKSEGDLMNWMQGVELLREEKALMAKKLETDEVLEELLREKNALMAAKKLEADKVFEELLQEEDNKMGAKEKISKRKARRLQKLKCEQAAADADSKARVSPEPAEDPEQKYCAALESLDVSLQCSLTLATMTDPVVTQYGHSFERKDIELWFKTKDTCPMTGVAVTSKALVPNHALKAVIAAAEALKEAAAEARERAAAEHFERGRQAAYAALQRVAE